MSRKSDAAVLGRTMAKLRMMEEGVLPRPKVVRLTPNQRLAEAIMRIHPPGKLRREMLAKLAEKDAATERQREVVRRYKDVEKMLVDVGTRTKRVRKVRPQPESEDELY